MTRRAARITHDEVVRMLKAARTMGLSIGNIRFDGENLDIVIKSGDSGDTVPLPSSQPETLTPLIREPKL